MFASINSKVRVEDLIQGVPPSSSVILRFNLKTGDTPIQPFSLFRKDVFALTHP